MQLNDLLLSVVLFILIKNNIDEKKKKRKPPTHESWTQNLGLKTKSSLRNRWKSWNFTGFSINCWNIGIVTTTLLQALSQKLNNACEAPQLVQFLTEAEAVYVEAIGGMNSVYSVESFCVHNSRFAGEWIELICRRIVVSDITWARENRRESWLQAGHTDSPWEADLKAWGGGNRERKDWGGWDRCRAWDVSGMRVWVSGVCVLCNSSRAVTHRALTVSLRPTALKG